MPTNTPDANTNGPESRPAEVAVPAGARLVSLDTFRGLVMFLLVAETTGLIDSLTEIATQGSRLDQIITQFHHHPWHGLRFWDLVQPYFMFIVGVAMAFSWTKRLTSGQSEVATFGHILYRCAMLFLLGVGLHCIYAHELRWELWNVLTQLSATILIAYSLMRLPARVQIGVAFALTLATDLTYRWWPVEGYDQPFTKGKNFGTWVDNLIMPPTIEHPNSGGWVAINCIPTAAHTIWGVVAGQLLLSSRSRAAKVGYLLLAGAVLTVAGYALDGYDVSPIIKRICTSSFTIVTGGWCLITLALLYLVVDVIGFRRWGCMFVVVGMNSIFIYLFSQTIGSQWFNGAVGIFTTGFLKPFSIDETVIPVITASTALALQWLLCYWLYRRNILIKL